MPYFAANAFPTLKMTRIVYLAGRNQMVVDQNNFVRIPELRKAHFFKLFRHERNEDIVDHHTIYI